MTATRKIWMGLALATASVLAAGDAMALSCAGVEARVNIRTSRLKGNIIAHIQSRTTQLVTQEVAERAQLLSALGVLTSQTSQSSQQEILAEQGASKAFADTIVKQSVVDQMRDAVANFGNTGFNACGLVQQGTTIAAKAEEAKTARAQVGDVVRARYDIRDRGAFEREMGDWSRLALNGDDLTAETLWSGDDAKAKDYIKLSLGPPRAVLPDGSPETARQIDRVAALQSLARSSVAATVMADVAASKRLDDALRDMAAQWTAGASAEKWAAHQAAGNQRASLLDTARIEAANVAMSANAVKRDYMEEFALAGFALTYVDRMQRENQ